jgi:hypothetical protein
MRLAGYIQDLKELLEKEGDLLLVYGSDDEGDNFEFAYHTPSVGMYNPQQRDFLSLREYDELKRKNELWYPENDKKVVCIN